MSPRTRTAQKPVEDEITDEDVALAEEVENDEVEVEDDDEAEAVVTPKTLAEELEISPKALRAFLRRKFPRGENAHGKSWTLTDAQVEAARKNWSETPDEDEESDEDAEDEA